MVLGVHSWRRSGFEMAPSADVKDGLDIDLSVD